jgi:hypothetical protein
MIEVKRVQTGVRIEAALLKVLKGLAASKDLSLGDLLEGICLHAFEGRVPFSRATIAQIGQLRQVYGLTLTAADSHRLVDVPRRAATARPAAVRQDRRRGQRRGPGTMVPR